MEPITDIPSLLEWEDSQEPALKLLEKLGWMPLSPAEALAARGGFRSRVLLETILEKQLAAINRIDYKGREYPFSSTNIRKAVEALRDLLYEGTVRTNERAYDLLTLPKTFEQEIEGDRKSFSLRYIDWEHPENNVYHVTKEFRVSGQHAEIRPDIVLFVNGIPFVVIECKRRDRNRSVDEGRDQMLRNQKPETGAPRLFYYAQLLLSVQPNQVVYGTVGTPAEYWTVWKEHQGIDEAVAPMIADRGEPGEQWLVREQDRMLYALCRPERVLELAYQYTLFDNGIKKIARYQQFFAVKNIMERIAMHEHDGRRRGGVIWHTQGSGKSLTMVMLSKSLLLSERFNHPRVVLVTDRVDLDDQIWKTFRACGRDPKQAVRGSHLFELLEDPAVEVIATVIDKFDAALNKRDYRNTSDNIFVLIDEAHRSQYGPLHARMRKVLPNACFLGFTGTPVSRKEKDTAGKLGGIIDVYPIEQAVADRAVVPLLYEGRGPLARVQQKPIDRGFDRVAEGLNEYQKRDLKAAFSTEKRLFESAQMIEEIAWDITRHYEKWKNTGLKGQLAATSKRAAIRYHECFQREGRISSAVVISPPDLREGEDSDDEDSRSIVNRFWRGITDRYGKSERFYRREILNDFARSDGIEILIVVDRLLVGFDEPRNTFFYNTKALHGHGLLQAIARVNRLFPGKDYGYIIDYRGVLGNLHQALDEYAALAEFDREDLRLAITSIRSEIEALPQRYSDLWGLFAGIANRKDTEAYEQHLADEGRRHAFLNRLSLYARTLQNALSTEQFHQQTPQGDIDRYIAALRFFQGLRATVIQRFSDRLDYREYDARIRRLMDMHVTVEEIQPTTQLVNIFEKEAFQQEVERVTGGSASKADRIASRTTKYLTENMDVDPVLYKRFSAMIEETVRAFYERRISELEYLNRVRQLSDEIVSGNIQGDPPVLINKPEARGYYHLLDKHIPNGRGNGESHRWRERLAEGGIEIDKIIEANKIVDWRNNPDIEKDMRNEIEDYLLMLGKELRMEFSYDQIDLILDTSIQIARSKP